MWGRQSAEGIALAEIFIQNQSLVMPCGETEAVVSWVELPGPLSALPHPHCLVPQEPPRLPCAAGRRQVCPLASRALGWEGAGPSCGQRSAPSPGLSGGGGTSKPALGLMGDPLASRHWAVGFT